MNAVAIRKITSRADTALCGVPSIAVSVYEWQQNYSLRGMCLTDADPPALSYSFDVESLRLRHIQRELIQTRISFNDNH